MTITLNAEHLYLAIIFILMAIQVYQWRVIGKMYKECDSLWSQIGVLASSIASQIISIQQELNKKEDKKSVKELID
jgi:hypothetical protein